MGRKDSELNPELAVIGVRDQGLGARERFWIFGRIAFAVLDVSAKYRDLRTVWLMRTIQTHEID